MEASRFHENSMQDLKTQSQKVGESTIIVEKTQEDFV